MYGARVYSQDIDQGRTQTKWVSMVPESAGLVTLVDLSSCDEVLAAGIGRDKRALAGTETAPSLNPSCSFSSQVSLFPLSA